jgi:hypothetical protein
MGALTDLWKSERGLVAVLLIVCSTVLAGMGKITYAEWREQTLYLFGIYASSKTVTSVADAVTSMKTPPAAADPAPTPVPTPAPAGQV